VPGRDDAVMLNLQSLALGAVTIVLVAACGGTAPTQSLAGSPAAATSSSSSGPVAATPSSAVPPSSVGASASLPSGQPSLPAITASHADPALEAMLPAAVGGTPLQLSSLTLKAVLDSGGNRPVVDAFLQSIGKTEADGTVALAFDLTGAVPGGISAFKVAGADPSALLAGIVSVEGSDLGSAATVSQATVGGKNVTVVTIGSGVNDTTWIYGHGDVVFVVKAPDSTGAAAFLELLP
jgi:hypothetical protein